MKLYGGIWRVGLSLTYLTRPNIGQTKSAAPSWIVYGLNLGDKTDGHNFGWQACRSREKLFLIHYNNCVDGYCHKSLIIK